jgi:hypothetical protein
VRRVVEFEGNGLIDRHGHGFRRGIAIIAHMNRDGFSLHALHILGAEKMAQGVLMLGALRAIAPEATAAELR